MKLALGVILLWLGSALLWVAGHGISSGGTGPGAIWQEILAGISGAPTD